MRPLDHAASLDRDRVPRPLFRLHDAVHVGRTRRNDEAAAAGGPHSNVKRCHDHSRRGSISAGDPALTTVNTDIGQPVTSTPWRPEDLDRMAERIGKKRCPADHFTARATAALLRRASLDRGIPGSEH